MPKRSMSLKSTSPNNKNTILNSTNLDKTDTESIPKHRKQSVDDPLHNSIRSKTKSNKNYFELTTDEIIERNFIDNALRVVHSIDHNVLPAFNVCAIPRDANEPLTLYPKYAFRNPEPIYVSANHCHKMDLCHRRPMAWESYRHSLHSAYTTYQNTRKDKKHVRAIEKKGIYHGSVYNLAERIYQQPDPYFHSSYDYYYTGGNLCYLPATQHILHCTGENMEILEVAKLTRPLVIGENNFIPTLPINITMNNCEIFEVTPLQNMTDISKAEYLLTRQRNVINLVQLKNDTKLKIISQFRSKSIPFISMAQSIDNPRILLITSMVEHIRSYDISRDSAKMANIYEISSANNQSMWNTIKPWQEHCFLYSNQYQLHLVDIRTNPDEWFKASISDNEENELCNHISALAVSSFKNLFYLATNHKLYCLDIRYINSGKLLNSNTTVCCWTHQCEYAPLLMDTRRFDKNEYIALSSPLADDIRICELSRQKNLKNVQLNASQKSSKYIYKSDCLPFQPMSLMETLNQARLGGKCLVPQSDIKARIKSCTTGMSFCDLKDGDSSYNYLIFSNSIGDIYAYTISKRVDSQEEVRCHDDAEEVMDRYSTEASRSQKHILNYSIYTDFKYLRKMITCDKYNNPPDFDSDDSDHYEEIEEDENEVGKYKVTKKLKSFGTWQKSLHRLHSCEHALSKNLISAWNIKKEEYDEDDTAVLDIEHLITKTSSFETKVSNWLDSNSDFQTTVENTNAEDTTINTSNCANEEQELTQTTQALHDRLQTNDNIPATSTVKRKTKKKYVKGF